MSTDVNVFVSRTTQSSLANFKRESILWQIRNRSAIFHLYYLIPKQWRIFAMPKSILLLILILMTEFSTVNAQEITPARMPRCTIAGRVVSPTHNVVERPSAEQKFQNASPEVLRFEQKKYELKEYLVGQYDIYKCQGQWYGYFWTLLESLIILSATASSLLAALGVGSWPWGKYLLVGTSTTAALSAAVIGQFDLKNEWLLKEKGAAQTQLNIVQVDYTSSKNPNPMTALINVYRRAIEQDLGQTVQSFSELGTLSSEPDPNLPTEPGK